MRNLKAHLVLAALALSLTAAYQNCSKAKFESVPVAVTDVASTAAPEVSPAPAPSSAVPVPTTTMPVAQQPAPVPSPTPTVPKVYSTCQSETVVQACPSNTPNCTCTDTLPGGTYDSSELIRGKNNDASNPDGSYDKGPQCLTGGTAVHSGTVVGPAYGVCRHFCTVLAKCINGQWQQFYVTW